MAGFTHESATARLATICMGGGEATAVALELPQGGKHA